MSKKLKSLSSQIWRVIRHFGEKEKIKKAERIFLFLKNVHVFSVRAGFGPGTLDIIFKITSVFPDLRNFCQFLGHIPLKCRLMRR